jgi:Cu2+-exporting ATPase
MGYGLIVNVEEKSIRLGSRRGITMSGIVIEAHIDEDRYHALGHELVYLAIDKQLAGVIELQPTIRPEAKHIVSTLKQRNMSIVIISGDHEQPTKKRAASLGIEQYFAETLPENKADLIEQLQKAPKGHDKGKSVCFPPRGHEAQCRRWHQ